ncbi:hypothetical protein N656DRAFT_802659 [Canariomyces notabilis]|uniref:Uncharacterized protein n=1 Tax=Canariomyces notabilis TaxID=2074819 RepID=A0AAN6QHF3_9PEZI|nr:hypothetical protein N656DRAFT_802659 [Canariomyces arenarius]
MTTNNPAQPGDSDSDGCGDANNDYNTLEPYYETDHLVFLVHVPRLTRKGYIRYLYVDLKDVIQPKSLGGGAHRGHMFKFSVKIMQARAGDTTTTPDGPGNDGRVPEGVVRVHVTSQSCQDPLHRYPAARMRPIGRVRRDACPDDVRRAYEEVRDQLEADLDLECCHNWTDAAIQRLRDSGVLRELRPHDDPAVRFGKDAVNDGTF